MRLLDAESVVPLYYQLKEILREDIEGGVWGPGEAIPSENELCERYVVSRATVRQAVGELCRQGLLYRRQGKGTFVAGAKLSEDLLGFYSFSREMRAKGHTVTSRVLSLEEARPSDGLRRTLGLGEDERVTQVVRLRLVDDEPLFLEKTAIPARLSPGLGEQDLSASPVFHRLLTERCGVRLAGVRKTIEPALADRYEAEVLGIRRGAPVLVVERLTLDAAGRPVVHGKWVVRGDRCKHYIDPAAP
jgi:GntR family transcriptional regulator